MPAHRFATRDLGAIARDMARFAGRQGIATLLLMVAAAMLEGVGLACFLPLIGLLTAAQDRRSSVLERGFAMLGIGDPGQRLIVIVGVFAGVMVVRSIVLALRDRSVARLQVGFVEHQRARLIDALGAADWSRVAGLRHARITDALSNGIASIAIAAQLLLQSTVVAVMLVGQWIVALLLAPRLAGGALVLMLLLAPFVLRRIFRRATRFGEAQTLGHLTLIDTAGQLLGGLKPAIAQNMQGAFTAAFTATSRALADAQLVFQNRHGRTRLGVGTLGALGGAAALLVGYRLGMSGAALLATLAIFSRMASPLTVLMQNLVLIGTHAPAHALMAALLRDLHQPPPAAITAPPRSFEGPIALENVAYRHGDGGGVSGITLAIAPGEVVGIVGASGAGKTTLVDLLTGLLRPERGTVRVGATAVDGDTATAWRDRIAYVAQEPYLFHDTIRRNLEWGSAGQGDAVLWTALAQAGAEPLVRAMEAGLDTVVGERGARLSGGERQRIALARALLRRPVLLILDEATNAIDVASERRILHGIVTRVPRPTIVLVAHRRETLEICDRLIELDAGRIVGQAAGKTASTP